MFFAFLTNYKSKYEHPKLLDESERDYVQNSVYIHVKYYYIKSLNFYGKK